MTLSFQFIDRSRVYCSRSRWLWKCCLPCVFSPWFSCRTVWLAGRTNGTNTTSAHVKMAITSDVSWVNTIIEKKIAFGKLSVEGRPILLPTRTATGLTTSTSGTSRWCSHALVTASSQACRVITGTEEKTGGLGSVVVVWQDGSQATVPGPGTPMTGTGKWILQFLPTKSWPELLVSTMTARKTGGGDLCCVISDL